MISQQELDCLQAMQSDGGSFAFAIGRAYLHGDARNRVRLRTAFADLFTRYGLPSEGRAEPATCDEMVAVAHQWQHAKNTSGCSFAAVMAFISWYYAQPEGGACHE